MSMRVLQLSTVHRWNDVRIYHKVARSLVEAGYDVHLMATVDAGDQPDPVEGITLHTLPVHASRLRRIASSLMAWARAGSIRARVVHIHDPELIPSALVLRLLGCKVLYDVHEDYPDKIFEKSWIPRCLRGIGRTAMRLMEWCAIRCCSGTIAATGHIGRRFSGRRSVVVRNFPVLGPEPAFDGEHRDGFVYAGLLSVSRGVQEMVTGFVGLQDDSVRLDLFGRFSDSKLESWVARQAGDESVRRHGWQKRSVIDSRLRDAVAGLVVLHPTGTYLQSLPIKLFEYMAAGIPVIASDFPSWREIIDAEQCGLLVDPLDPVAVRDAMRWMLDHPGEAVDMGRRGRRAVVERYNWQTECATMLDLYRSLADPR